MPLRLCVFVGLMLAFCGHSAHGDNLAAGAASRNVAASSITSSEVNEFVSALADDTFEGRASGTRGGRAAGIYITERLKKWGLRSAAAKGSFYQSFGNYHNILAMVEGSDPTLKEQVILIGAHYDHVGYGTARTSYGPLGMIHNGADDNASGVVGVLEVAKALSNMPEKPKRSILFAFWDGEELGLIGSQHWAENPTVALRRIPLVVNADMIGRLRNSRVQVYGVRSSGGLRRLISRGNNAAQLSLDFTWEMRSDSDHHTFFSRDIPIVMLHTGLHGDYHRPSDDADKINVEGLTQVAQLMFSMVVELADAPSLLPFRAQARNESTSDQRRVESSLPPLPGRLGVRWDENRARKDGSLVLTGVGRGSAADRAGLQVGDRLLKFANREIEGISQFRLAVLAAKSPVPATVERLGSTDPIEVVLNLPGEPVRLGISWRTDETEAGSLIINRVTPGSPADLAGLRVNDRIYRVAGQLFTDGEQFRHLAATQPSALELEVETDGRVRTVEIPPVPDFSSAPSSADPSTSDPAKG